MFDMLDKNEADAIITLDSHSYRKDYIIAKEKALSMHFVTSSRSKFASARNLKIEDIAGEPFILTEYGQGYRRVFDKELAKRSLEITPVLEIGRTDIITNILTKTEMISYLPDFVTEELVNRGELCYLDVCDMEIEIWKQLIYHKNKWMSKSLKTVIDYIKSHEFTN
jgi:DNA-binding transcriptional LysR family regulator